MSIIQTLQYQNFVYHTQNFPNNITSVCGYLRFIISKWASLSDGLLWLLLIAFKVTGQLIGLGSVGLTIQKCFNGHISIRL